MPSISCKKKASALPEIFPGKENALPFFFIFRAEACGSAFGATFVPSCFSLQEFAAGEYNRYMNEMQGGRVCLGKPQTFASALCKNFFPIHLFSASS
jgi:hypothetical protein